MVYGVVEGYIGWVFEWLDKGVEGNSENLVGIKGKGRCLEVEVRR